MSVLKKFKPELFDAWVTFTSNVFAEGALSAKHKELMAMALSIATNCEPCVKIHTRRARQFKASDAEIAETVAVAVALLGGPADVWPRDTIINELEK